MTSSQPNLAKNSPTAVTIKPHVEERRYDDHISSQGNQTSCLLIKFQSNKYLKVFGIIFLQLIIVILIILRLSTHIRLGILWFLIQLIVSDLLSKFETISIFVHQQYRKFALFTSIHVCSINLET